MGVVGDASALRALMCTMLLRREWRDHLKTYRTQHPLKELITSVCVSHQWAEGIDAVVSEQL